MPMDSPSLPYGNGLFSELENSKDLSRAGGVSQSSGGRTNPWNMDMGLSSKSLPSLPYGSGILTELEKAKELKQAKTNALSNYGSDPMREAEIRAAALRYGIKPPESAEGYDGWQKRILLKDVDTWGQSPTTVSMLANKNLSKLIAGQPEVWERIGILDTLAEGWKSGRLSAAIASAFQNARAAATPTDRVNPVDYLYNLSAEEEASGVSFDFLRRWADRTDSPIIASARQDIARRAQAIDDEKAMRARYAPEEIAQGQYEQSRLSQNETLARMSADGSIGNAILQTVLNPVDVIGYTGAQSLATSAGTYAAATGTGLAGGALGYVGSALQQAGALAGAGSTLSLLGAASPIAAVGILASGSFEAEYGATMIDQLEKAGINTRDPAALRAAFKNGSLMEQIDRAASSRAFAVSSLDYLSGMAAGIPLHPITNILRAKGIVKAGEHTVGMARGRVAEDLILQGGLQSAAGAAGEALGQAVIGEDINPTDVYLEAIGEFVTAPFDVASARSSYLRYVVEDRVKATRSMTAGQTREQAYQSMAETQLAKTAPDVAAQAVQQAFKDTPINTMVFDAEDLRPVSERMAQLSPSFARQWADASASGDAIYIPFSEACQVRLQDESVGQTLFQKARLSADDMSLDEATAYASNYDTGLQERVTKMLDASQAAITRRREARARADSALKPVYDELVSSGKLTPEQASAFVGLQSSLLENMATMVGEDPWSFFQKNAMQVAGVSEKGGGMKGFHKLGEFVSSGSPAPEPLDSTTGEFVVGSKKDRALASPDSTTGEFSAGGTRTPIQNMVFSLSGTSIKEGPISTNDTRTHFLGQFGQSEWTANTETVQEKKGNVDDGKKLFGDGGTTIDDNALPFITDENMAREATENTRFTTMNADGSRAVYDENGAIIRNGTAVGKDNIKMATGRSIKSAKVSDTEVAKPEPGQYAEAAPGNSIANYGGNDAQEDMVRSRSATDSMSDRLENAVNRNVRAGETTEQKAQSTAEREESLAAVPGSRQILGNFDPDTNVITIFKTDDPSVFLHEAGHYWLTTLLRTAAAILHRGKVDEAGNVLNATAEEIAFLRLVRDFMAWGGVYDRETQDLRTAVDEYLARDEDGQREFQERFADSFAAYVERGKAPSERIKAVFDKCVDWLKAAFMNVHRANVEISPEVAALFDRLFVAEEYVSDAKRAMGPEILDGFRKLGATDEDIRAIVDMDALSRASAEASVRQAMSKDAALVYDSEFMSAQRDRQEAGIEQDYENIAREKRRELEGTRAFRMLRFLDGTGLSVVGGDESVTSARGEVSEDSPGPRLVQFNDGSSVNVTEKGQAATVMHGKIAEDSLQGLSPETQARLRDAGVVSPDGDQTPTSVQMLFQYDSVDAMAEDLARAHDTDVDQVVKAMADEAFLEEYGVAHTADKVRGLAEQAVHNEFALRTLALQYGAMTKSIRSSPRKLAATKAFVRDRIADMPLAESRISRMGNQYWMLVSRRAYDKLAKRAEQKAWDLFGKGDVNNAAIALETALVNSVTADELGKVRTVADAFPRRMRALAKSKSVSGAYHVQLNRLLFGLGFNTKPYENEPSFASFLAEHPDVKELFDRLSGNLQQTLLAVGPNFKADWQSLSIQDFRDLADFMKAFGRLGRLYEQGKKRDAAIEAGQVLTDIRKEAEANDKALGRTKRPEMATETTRRSRIIHGIKTFLAWHIRGINALEIFDGNTQGAATKAVGWEADRCTADETEMNQSIAAKLTAALKPLFRDLNGGFFGIPSKNYKLNRQNGIAVLLYRGTAKGTNRLVRNHGFTNADFAAIARQFTAEELEAVNKVWAHFESLRQKVGALERKLNGLEPEWEQSTPFDVVSKDGVTVHMTGGYVPIRYDREQSSAKVNGVSLEDLDNQALLQGITSHTTSRSFLKQRANQVDDGLRLQLSLDSIFVGTNEIIHDLAWREFGQRTYKILHGVDVKTADGQSQHYDGLLQMIKERYGEEGADLVEKWFENVMTGGRHANDEKGASVILNAIRQGVSIAGLGLNFTTALVQITGIIPAMTRIPQKYMLRALGEAVAHPRSMRAEITARSKTMRTRSITRIREVNDVRNRVSSGRWAEARNKLYDVAYYPMLTVQGFVDHIVWGAAFEQAMEEKGMVEEDAAKYADRMVIDTQGSGTVSNLAGVESGKPLLKLFTTFYSFMGTMYNLNMGSLLGEKNRPKAYTQILALTVVMPVLEAILRGAIQPGDDDDEWDKLSAEEKAVQGARKIAAAGVSSLLGQFFVLREIAQATSSFTEGGPIYSYRGPSGLRAVSDYSALLQQIQQGEFDAAFWKAFSNMAGDFGLWPSAQVNRFIQGCQAWDADKSKNPMVFLLGYKEK